MSRKSRALPPSPFRRFNSSPEVIRLVVMMYVRFPLSLRNVEDLPFERGIDIRHETVRHWTSLGFWFCPLPRRLLAGSPAMLIGSVPPAALVDWRYLAVSLAAGLICFFWTSGIEKLRNPARVLDALGLALFAVVGTEKALGFGLSPFMAALLGMLTGIGGGGARDVLLAEIPAVLRSDLYAVAALAGASAVVAGSLLDLPIIVTALGGGLTCFGRRMIAISRKWRLPVAHDGTGGNDDADGGDGSRITP